MQDTSLHTDCPQAEVSQLPIKPARRSNYINHVRQALQNKQYRFLQDSI